MHIFKSFACVLLLPTLLAACGSEGDLIVAGTVDRVFEEFSFNGPFEPNPGAHVRIEARAYMGEDGPSPLVAASDEPFAGELPFAFELRTRFPDAPVEAESLMIHVEVYNHPGTESAPGDLVTEIFTDAIVGDDDVVVKVSGLEACSAPNHGGFCG
jgi:hypothetical protein